MKTKLPTTSVYMGEARPVKLSKSVEDAVLYAIKSLVKQSKALSEADYTTYGTVRALRRHLKLDLDGMAEKLSVTREWLEKFEGQVSAMEVGKTMAYTAKTIDEVYRLLSFASGGPDSRPQISVGDLLKYLTADQFNLFVEWVEQAKNKKPEQAPPAEADILQ
ncbi:MAG TPA: hypothetical protein VIH42_15025 [Thermoguttaceae bacterium]